MLCSKLYCKKRFNSILFSYKIPGSDGVSTPCVALHRHRRPLPAPGPNCFFQASRFVPQVAAYQRAPVHTKRTGKGGLVGLVACLDESLYTCVAPSGMEQQKSVTSFSNFS